MIISDLGAGGAQKNFTFVANILAGNDFDLSIYGLSVSGAIKI